MESYSVEAILSAVDKNFTSTMQGAERSMGGLNSNSQKTGSSILNIAKGVGVFKLVQGGLNLVRNSTGAAIDRFDTLNKYPTVMKALGYSTKEVDQSMKKLDKGIDGLPTSFDEIVSSAQQLAISTGSLDKGTDTAIALNNAFLASGASTADASRGMQQYRQMLSKGTVDMQSWRTLQETMPIAMDKVAKSFKEQGVNSVNDLYDALKDGDITFEDFNNRMIKLNEGVGGFADLAKKNSKGIRTSFKNIKTAVTKGIANVIKAIDEGMKNAGLGSIADNLDKVKGAVNAAFNGIIKIIPPIMNAIAAFVSFVKKHSDIILPILAGIAGAFLALKVASVISVVVTGLQGILTAMSMVKSFAGAFSILKMGIAAIGGPVAVVAAAIGVLIGVFVYLYRTNENFRNGVKAVWTAIQNTIQTVILIVSAFIQSVWGALTAWWNANGEQIKEAANIAWQFIQNKIIAVMEFLSPYIQGAWQIIENIISTTWDNIKLVVRSALGVIQGIIKIVTGLISGDWKRVWEGIKQVASSIWNAITGIIGNNLNLAKSIVITVLSGMKDVFSGIMDSIKNIVSRAVDNIKELFNLLGQIDLASAGRAIIDGFLSGLKAGFEKVKRFIGGIADWIKKNKGPISYDKRLLIPAGNAIMGGLNDGLNTGFEDVQKNVSSMADRLAEPFSSGSFSIGNNVAQINKSVNGQIDHEFNMSNTKQPATFNIRFGNQQFKAFVDDISQAQGQETEINLGF